MGSRKTALTPIYGHFNIKPPDVNVLFVER